MYIYIYIANIIDISIIYFLIKLLIQIYNYCFYMLVSWFLLVRMCFILVPFMSLPTINKHYYYYYYYLEVCEYPEKYN